MKLSKPYTLGTRPNVQFEGVPLYRVINIGELGPKVMFGKGGLSGIEGVLFREVSLLILI